VLFKDILASTAAFVEPNDAQFYLMGRMQENDLPPPKNAGGFEGEFGHDLRGNKMKHFYYDTSIMLVIALLMGCADLREINEPTALERDF
jgi:hypothetical protein